MIKPIIFSSFLLLATLCIFGQKSKYELFITPSANLYMPGGTSVKQPYPNLWYNNNTKPKLLIGGFGIGATFIKKISEKLQLRTEARLSKHTYWNEETIFTDNLGNDFGSTKSGSSDFIFSLNFTAHYFLSKKISIGGGLGSQILLVSLSRNPASGLIVNGTTQKNDLLRNRYYKPVMPVIPIELSLRQKRAFYTLRYEYALLNKMKGELANYQSEKYGTLAFEIGLKIN
jgi:hypothetical protein